METIERNTSQMMTMLLLLFLWLSGSLVLSSPLNPKEMALLEMMLRDGGGYPSIGRSLRDISVLPATSIGCDENDSEEDFKMFDDFEESEECDEFLPPCETTVVQEFPINDPCFMRLILLRTPLLKHDPCANFTLAQEMPQSTEKPKKPKKKCDPKLKDKNSKTPGTQNGVKAMPNTDNKEVKATPNTGQKEVKPLPNSGQKEVKAMPNTGKKEVKAKPNTGKKEVKAKPNTEKEIPSNTGEDTTTETNSNSTTIPTATTEKILSSTTKRLPHRKNGKKTPPRTRTRTTTTEATTAGATTTEEATTTEYTTTEIISTTNTEEAETEEETTTATTTTTPAPTRTTKTAATRRTTRAIPINEDSELKSMGLRRNKGTTTVPPRTKGKTTVDPRKPSPLRKNRQRNKGTRNGGNGKPSFIPMAFQINGKPRVPDTPKIKIDGQPSEVIQVVHSNDAGEMRLAAEETATSTPTPMTSTTSEPETTTTEESCEEEMETPNEGENETEETEEYFPETEEETEEDLYVAASEMDGAKSTSTTEEPCVDGDTDDQGTNLCPQFMPGYGSSNSRPPPGSRFRKPVKNYVEPILYEGSFAKPRQRIGLTQPQPPRRDYFVSNKQIVPRPRPKYRKRLPHSIYMNNIISGVDCVDDVTASPYPQPFGPIQPSQGQRNWPARRLTGGGGGGGGYGSVQRSPGYGPGPAPVQRIHSSPAARYPGSSEEEQQHYQNDGERESNEDQHYFEEEAAALMRAPNANPNANPTASIDPCQAEHDHPLYGQHLQQAENDYAQSKNFFT